eukprot:5991357-Amphidinium_carterae.1
MSDVHWDLIDFSGVGKFMSFLERYFGRCTDTAAIGHQSNRRLMNTQRATGSEETCRNGKDCCKTASMSCKD